MNSLLEYRGNVEYSAPDHCVHGKIIGISALVTYEGVDISSLEEAFKDSVDDYIEFCEEKGIAPEKEYSGRFQIRTMPEIHKFYADYAAVKGEKLNTVVSRALVNFCFWE
ncbi:MAG: type II toxin-antitoxin system HicB family antitoxin [Clostridiales Family XIII bacterium]|jgi:predicted HicB family RNase H-like nuclease|nr:type II toxin-antitoxin system HicB family antitoxin [Clostridiales Family XIII bacterium]